MDLQHVPAAAVGDEAVERLARALLVVDRAGLLAVLIDREHDAAVQELLVDVDRRRRRQEDRHRPRDPVGVGDQPARGAVLASRGDPQLTLGLQQLQRVGGALGALLLGDRQHLVREIGLAHVPVSDDAEKMTSRPVDDSVPTRSGDVGFRWTEQSSIAWQSPRGARLTSRPRESMYGSARCVGLCS
jgi:hypothetical protein